MLYKGISIEKYTEENGFRLLECVDRQNIVVECHRGHITDTTIYYLDKLKCRECKALDFSDEVKQCIVSRGCKLLNTYENCKTELRMLCPKNHVRECTYGSFLKSGCKKCTDEKKLLISIKKIEELGYTIVSKPKSGRDIVEAICPFGHMRTTKIHNFFNGKCFECAGNAPKNLDFCIQEFQKQGFKLLEKEYVGAQKSMRYMCSCGEISETSIDNIIRKRPTSCRHCKGKRMSGNKHHNWNFQLTEEDRDYTRNYNEYGKWRKDVYSRDMYTCQ